MRSAYWRSLFSFCSFSSFCFSDFSTVSSSPSACEGTGRVSAASSLALFQSSWSPCRLDAIRHRQLRTNTRVSPVSGDASRVLNAQDMGAMFARAMLLVFVSASFAACQDNDRPGSALDRSPELKRSLDSFRKSVKTSGCAGRVVIDLTVREVQNPKIASPTRLESRTDITDQIHNWRFCPAVRFNRYATVRMRFNIQVTAED